MMPTFLLLAWEIGYDIRWRPIGAATLADENRTVTSEEEALARSYNRVGPGERSWAEVESADGAIGVARAHGWPVEQPDLGWSEDGRTDGAPRVARVAWLRVR